MRRSSLLLAALVLAARPALGDCFDSPRSGVDWRNCALYSRDFSGADLSGADMTGGRFTRTDFSGADLSGAVLRKRPGLWPDCADMDIHGCARHIAARLDRGPILLSGAGAAGCSDRSRVSRRTT